MPNGRQLKQNLPTGVIKVVSRADFSDNLISQKPELASSLVKFWLLSIKLEFAPQMEGCASPDVRFY